jgi:GcrA cell cycle regulator
MFGDATVKPPGSDEIARAWPGNDRGKPMQPSNWGPAHCDALREYLGRGMSYSEIADAINAKFNTAYSRSAAISRAKRMGLAVIDQPKQIAKEAAKDSENDLTGPLPKAALPSLHRLRERYVAVLLRRPMPVFEPVETLPLRCVDIVPRRLSLFELQAGDCRYPYGGDEEGQAITFCGHPRRRHSSYCTPHFHLTRGPGTAAERAAGTLSRWIVEEA